MNWTTELPRENGLYLWRELTPNAPTQSGRLYPGTMFLPAGREWLGPFTEAMIIAGEQVLFERRQESMSAEWKPKPTNNGVYFVRRTKAVDEWFVAEIIGQSNEHCIASMISIELPVWILIASHGFLGPIEPSDTIKLDKLEDEVESLREEVQSLEAQLEEARERKRYWP